MAGKGYFSSPYELKTLRKLATSADVLERWEAANALGNVDEVTATKVLQLFQGEKDPLVLAALSQFSLSESTKQPQPVPRSPKQKGKALETQTVKPRGEFWIAFSQPLGPLKIARLGSEANTTAKNAVQAKNIASKRETTFPQANSISKAMEMVDQIIESRAVHGATLGLESRQVLYYLNALRFSGFVSMPSKNNIKLDESLASVTTGYQRIRLIIVKLLSIPTVAAAYLGLTNDGKNPVEGIPRDFNELVVFLEDSTDCLGISGSTVSRRAATAVSWARQIAKVLNQEVNTGDQWPVS